MNEEKIKEYVEEALNPEEFDILDYLDDAPLAQDTVSIYMDVQKSRELSRLMAERQEVIRKARESEQKGKVEVLGLDETADDDTEYDEAINELVEELEKTKMTFHMKSVAPALVRAIDKSYLAKRKEDMTEEESAKYDDKRASDILSRAIDYVVVGDGRKDTKEWTGERLADLEKRLYSEQADRLISSLYDMVYAGHYLEQAITADF